MLILGAPSRPAKSEPLGPCPGIHASSQALQGILTQAKVPDALGREMYVSDTVCVSEGAQTTRSRVETHAVVGTAAFRGCGPGTRRGS